MFATRSFAVLGRRTCAVLAAGSGALHGLVVGHAGSPVLVLLIVGMAGACLYCAWELWTSGSLRSWCAVAVMNLAMIAMHLSTAGHHHGATVARFAAPPTAVMTAATVLAAVEVAIATTVMCVQTRGRTVATFERSATR